jgi:small nuclear ribonucleoprotein (snRNP)-like protein
MQVTVELKNDLAISGTLHSVDQYLNIKLHNTQVRLKQSGSHEACAAFAATLPHMNFQHEQRVWASQQCVVAAGFAIRICFCWI